MYILSKKDSRAKARSREEVLLHAFLASLGLGVRISFEGLYDKRKSKQVALNTGRFRCYTRSQGFSLILIAIIFIICPV
ncbi:MAG: hypothetical protein COA78_05940 [Blastopirellula sp.]|nr:MAG: hypothetical protein COA78_05940 [Blastopirellula sp.]